MNLNASQLLLSFVRTTTENTDDSERTTWHIPPHLTQLFAVGIGRQTVMSYTPATNPIVFLQCRSFAMPLSLQLSTRCHRSGFDNGPPPDPTIRVTGSLYYDYLPNGPPFSFFLSPEMEPRPAGVYYQSGGSSCASWRRGKTSGATNGRPLKSFRPNVPTLSVFHPRPLTLPSDKQCTRRWPFSRGHAREELVQGPS